MSMLNDLCDWYGAQCDGDWEHSFGVSIKTLDNPGWWVRINLRDTVLEDALFTSAEEGNSDSDNRWINCKIEDGQWHGMGDPWRLEEIIGQFINWAKSHDAWLSAPDTAALKERDNRELWAHLGRMRTEEPCHVPDCDHNRIQNSVFCRPHHWERVLGRPSPFSEGAP